MRRHPTGGTASSWLLLMTVGAAVALPIYHASLDYGFRYDDYYLVRPHTLSEVLASFSGNWDPGGVMVPFYRPLTVTFHALRFELFHLDAWSYHLASLITFIIVAAGLGWFVSRATASRPLGVVAAALTAAAPGMPAGAVAWVTNQMHLLQMVVFVVAVLWWTVCRCRSARWWVPLLVLQVIAFLIKEDGVMLLPTIVVVHVLHGAVVESRWRRPPWAFLSVAIALLVVLVLWRNHVLGGLGGYTRPTLDAAERNYWRGLLTTFLQRPPDRRWQPLLAVMTAALLPLGLVITLLTPRARRAGFVLVAGLSVALLYDVPFALVTKSEQYYMLATGASLALAGAVGAIAALARTTRVRVLVLALSGGLVVPMAAVARDIADDFGPYFPFTLQTDAIVLTWAAIPPEVRSYLEEKRARWDRRHETLRMRDWVGVASYGLYDQEMGSDGDPFRWTSRHVQFYARCQFTRVDAEVRALTPGLATRPVTTTFLVDGSPVRQLRLAAPTWTKVEIPLPPCSSLRVSSSRKVELVLDRTWSPKASGANPGDPRELGVMLRKVQWLAGRSWSG